jgi:leader peptidase (prepilin peptidase)/N-methyltransferase
VAEPLSTVSEQVANDESERWAPPGWAVLGAAGLAIGTVLHLGFSINSVAWALLQIVLVGIAAYDLVNRRVKNAVTIPVSLLALISRAAFERSAFVEVLFAGLIAFLAFLALALLLRGGLGMGDVKLAGMLGFLLGTKVLEALFIGAVAGGVAAAVVLARSTGRHSTMAYGPYLALGGAVAVLLAHPPHLI